MSMTCSGPIVTVRARQEQTKNSTGEWYVTLGLVLLDDLREHVLEMQKLLAARGDLVAPKHVNGAQRKVKGYPPKHTNTRIDSDQRNETAQ
jgi:hypothetical protein